MTITCVITDDEPMARKGLQSYVERVDFLSLTGVCEDAIQLNTLLKTQQPDLLLLDIEMPYLSGLDLLATLNQPPKVIVTSAYEQYALKGYELDVVDYLLKPISFERFLKGVNKVHDLLARENTPDADASFFVKSEKQMRKIYLRDILFVEALENYVSIYTTSGRVLTHSTLKRIDLEKMIVLQSDPSRTPRYPIAFLHPFPVLVHHDITPLVTEHVTEITKTGGPEIAKVFPSVLAPRQ